MDRGIGKEKKKKTGGEAKLESMEKNRIEITILLSFCGNHSLLSVKILPIMDKTINTIF